MLNYREYLLFTYQKTDDSDFRLMYSGKEPDTNYSERI
jgi:hypothetical protein